MRVQHNIAAMNSYRIYNNNANTLGKNLEKLSSGYRINRAGDDAAGLAISEKMRGQITGLNAATKNVKDGIALVQTAEGAIQEVHDMLGRMKYLATQSSNGTYQDEVDRENLQKEVDALVDEIDRIADSANFNGQKLLDGSLAGGATKVSISGVTSTSVKAAAGSYTIAMNAAGDWAGTGAQSATDGSSWSVTVGLDDGTSYTVKLTARKMNGATNANVLVNEKGDVVANLAKAGSITETELLGVMSGELQKTSLGKDFSVAVKGNGFQFTSLKEGTNAPAVKAVGFTKKDGTSVTNTSLTSTEPVDAGRDFDYANHATFDGTNFDDAVFTINGKKFVKVSASMSNAVNLGSDVTILNSDVASAAAAIQKATGLKANATTNNITLSGNGGEGKGLQLQIGDSSDTFNKMEVRVSDLHTNALGLNKVDISTADGAAAAIETIKKAIDTVSSTRGDLGAVQNRLEHTSNNLSVMTENLQNAESNIRDTDVADEMMKYTKNNILLQSAQAMLAQANQLPQGVLQLLQ